MIVVAGLLLIVVIGGPILLIVVVVRAIANGRTNARAHQEQRNADQAWLAGYTSWTAFNSPYDRSFIAVDFAAGVFDIGKVGDANRFSITKIVSVDLAKSMETDTSGYTSTTPFSDARLTSTQRLGRLSLNVRIEDWQNPYFEVLFLAPTPDANVKTREQTVATMQTEAERFREMLTDAVAKASGGAPVPAAASSQPAPASSAGEADAIKRLWDLKQAGALTEAEFNDQKAKLLGAG